MRQLIYCSIATSLTLIASTPSVADEIIEEYRACISQNDLHNSSGQRLTQPWEIIRQDRANYHRFGLADPDDYFDSFFASEKNREIVERMLMRGTITQSAGSDLVGGDVFVRVQIYGRGSRGNSVAVTVEGPGCATRPEQGGPSRSRIE